MDKARVRAVVERVLLAGALLFGLRAVIVAVEPHYPIQLWLVWRYLFVWMLGLFFAGACLVGGHEILARARLRAPVGETLALSFATGVLAFASMVFVLGLVHGLYAYAFFAIPASLLAVGGKRFYLRARSFVRHVRAARGRGGRGGFRAWEAIGVVATLLGVSLVYLPTISPEQIGFDSNWYHIPIAEHYAAAHAIRPFAEGFYPGASPHLASLLYTWVMLLPRVKYVVQSHLVLQVELMVFLGTLLAIPSTVRRLVPGARGLGSAAVMFLFPTVFLCDLNGGADHVAALFALPSFLALLRAWPRLDPAWSALMSAMAGAALMVKFSALPVFLPPVVAYAGRAAWVWGKALRARAALPWKGPVVALVVGVATTSMWWLKNWVFYGNPTYPEQASRFRGTHPLHAQATAIHEWWKLNELAHPPNTWAGWKERLYQVWHFSQQTHDWDFYAGKTPVFGFLFTMLALALPFARAHLRLWGLFAFGNLAVVGWYSIHHQERYLQASLPWFAAAAAGMMVHLWRRRDWVVRVPLVALVGFQVLWGLDLYTLPSHRDILTRVITLVGTGFGKAYDKRDGHFEPWAGIRRDLPLDAKVLIHEHHEHAGLMRQWVLDWTYWQGGLSYGELGTTRAIWKRLREMGVTHVVFRHSARAQHPLSDDLVFWDFARRLPSPKDYADMTLAPLPATWSDDTGGPTKVAFAACASHYAPGVYSFETLRRGYHEDGPFAKPESPGLPLATGFAGVRYAVLEKSCYAPGLLPGTWQELVTRGELALFARR